MNTSSQLPTHSTPQNRPMKRHHTARYYAHRVRESLTTRLSKLICAIFLALLLIVGITTFILWLSLRPHRPRFHIHNFSVSGLTQENGFQNTQIVFSATARNVNQNIGIYYDSMSASAYYKDKLIGSTPLLFPFYQKPKNTTVVAGGLSGDRVTLTSQSWMEAISDRAEGAVVFRLDITSVIRFRISTWDSKHHRMHANCEVAVGPDGVILPTSKDKRCPVMIVLALLLLVLWQSMMPKSPDFTITNVYVQSGEGKNATFDHQTTRNTSMVVDFTISNPNNCFDICYDQTNVTLLDNNVAVSAKTIPAFCQGHKKSVVRELVVKNGGNRTTEMGLRLETRVRYKIFRLKTKHHGVIFEGYVGIGSDVRGT